MKYTGKLFYWGVGLQLAVMLPFLLFDIIKDPWWAEPAIIANSFWIGRIVSYYYRHIKGKCMTCGHGDYYHVMYNLDGRQVPSCFHKKGKFTTKEWIHDTIPFIFLRMGSTKHLQQVNFCRCENYVSKSLAIERIKKTRIEP